MSDKNGDFVVELQTKRQELTQGLASKKSDLFRLDSEQKKLAALIESEKHSQSNPKDHKNKHHAPSKDIRTDILKNETKFKDQAKKLEEMRKEVRHLEDELKSVNHDLQVVGA